MTSLLFGLQTVISRVLRSRDNRRTRSRRITTPTECLESRNLLTGGSVMQSGVFVYVTPTSTGANTAIVSYQNVNGVTKLDVNLNGIDNYFSTSQVGFVCYKGSAASGAQTFENLTNVFTEAWGGSGNNVFMGGTRSDEFFGGSGTNTFDAGSGNDELIGGTGANVFNENSSGSGIIEPNGANNTINTSASSTGIYRIL